MITKKEVEKRINEDVTFKKIAKQFYKGHIDYMRWFEPEYNEDFNEDFILKYWDEIALFQRGEL